MNRCVGTLRLIDDHFKRNIPLKTELIRTPLLFNRPKLWFTIFSKIDDGFEDEYPPSINDSLDCSVLNSRWSCSFQSDEEPPNSIHLFSNLMPSILTDSPSNIGMYILFYPLETLWQWHLRNWIFCQPTIFYRIINSKEIISCPIKIAS